MLIQKLGMGQICEEGCEVGRWINFFDVQERLMQTVKKEVFEFCIQEAEMK